MRRKNICAAGVLVCLVATVLLGQTGDAWIGSWTLNPGKSQFSASGTSMVGRTVEYRTVPGGVQAISETTPLNGKPVHLEYIARYDGADVPITDSTGQSVEGQSIAVTRFDENSFETVQKLGPVMTLVSRYFVSADGNTLIATLTIIGFGGRQSTDLIVLDRVRR